MHRLLPERAGLTGDYPKPQIAANRLAGAPVANAVAQINNTLFRLIPVYVCNFDIILVEFL